MSENLLEIKNVTVKFKDFLLDNIKFNVETGTIMGLIGENGAGKSTLMKSILNTYPLENGEIKVDGYDHIENEKKVKNLIGYVAAEDYLMFNTTFAAVSNTFSKLYDEWDEEFVSQYVAKWNIPTKKKFSEFSKGMKTKVMLILAIAHKPKLLLLDEPTAGLDPMVRMEVLEVLREFVEDGERAVLFSTHITSDLDKIADYITIISNGKMLGCESADMIEEKYVVVSGNIDELDEIEGCLIGVIKEKDRFSALAERKNLSGVKDIYTKRPTVEEILMHFVKEHTI